MEPQLPPGLDFSRHREKFDPRVFGHTRVDVLGGGAVGSRVLLELVGLGVSNLHVWDFDIVEKHNLPNQAFFLKHVGMPKVEALQDLAEMKTGARIHAHNQKIIGTEPFGRVIFLMVDSMASRNALFDQCMKLNLGGTRLIIEARMTENHGELHAIHPGKPHEVKGWKAFSDYTDEEGVVSACGASVSVGPTAGLVAMLAMWQFLRWYGFEMGGVELDEENALEHRLVVDTEPMNLQYQMFDL